MTKTDDKPAASPDDLLKAVVSGKAEDTAAKAMPPVERSPRIPAWLRGDKRLIGAAAAALALGTALGAGIAALSGHGRVPNDPVAALSATLDAGRIETARLAGEVAHLTQAMTEMRSATDTARREAATRGTALGERLAQVDKAIVARIAALSERIDQTEREQNARIAALSAQLDRRPAVAVPTAAKAEPTQTSALADIKAAEPKLPETKPTEAKPKAVADKPAVIDAWAVRDVYDGAAILENRRRKIVEVGPGDTLPGVGRVEAVERHGREWVVVTRQGVVTAQPW